MSRESHKRIIVTRVVLMFRFDIDWQPTGSCGGTNAPAAAAGIDGTRRRGRAELLVPASERRQRHGLLVLVLVVARRLLPAQGARLRRLPVQRHLSADRATARRVTGNEPLASFTPRFSSQSHFLLAHQHSGSFHCTRSIHFTTLSAIPFNSRRKRACS